MNHQLDSCPSVLRRWAEFQPGTMLPNNFKNWEYANLPEALRLKREDPELHQLLSGTASAELKLRAIEGTLALIAPPAPDPKAVALQAAYDAKPYEEGGSLTQRLMLEVLSPSLAAEQAKKAKKEADGDVQRQKALQAKANDLRVRAASKNGFSGRVS